MNLFNSIRKYKEFITYPKLFAYILNYIRIYYWWLFKYLHILNLKIIKFVKWKGTKVIHLWHICPPLCRSRRGRTPSYFSECEETTKDCRDCHDIRARKNTASKITGKTGGEWQDWTCVHWRYPLVSSRIKFWKERTPDRQPARNWRPRDTRNIGLTQHTWKFLGSTPT